jgi:hypothetical protein
MSKENLCWTCSKALTKKCPKHANPEIEKKMWRKQIYECPEYDYDGECLHCALNPEHRKGRLYKTCPYFIKGCEGYCSQMNFMNGTYTLEIPEGDE